MDKLNIVKKSIELSGVEYADEVIAIWHYGDAPYNNTIYWEIETQYGYMAVITDHEDHVMDIYYLCKEAVV